MKSKPATNPLSDTLYEYENPPFTLSGPLKYKGDLHPSFRIDSPDGIIGTRRRSRYAPRAFNQAKRRTAAMTEITRREELIARAR
jgi:hypothetical protein